MKKQTSKNVDYNFEKVFSNLNILNNSSRTISNENYVIKKELLSDEDIAKSKYESQKIKNKLKQKGKRAFFSVHEIGTFVALMGVLSLNIEIASLLSVPFWLTLVIALAAASLTSIVQYLADFYRGYICIF